MDVVGAFRAGAADYLRMPCYFPEILARVERAQAASPVNREVTLDDVAVSLDTFAARVGNHAFQMTEREARILAALIRCPNHPVSREALMRVAGITKAKPTLVHHATHHQGSTVRRQTRILVHVHRGASVSQSVWSPISFQPR